MTGQRDSAHRLIREWLPGDAAEERTHADFVAAFSGAETPLGRGQGATHATASCVVFDPTLTATLLVFHRKGCFWVQPGGHLEPDDSSIPQAALRELEEETGIRGLPERSIVAYDLDHHQLPEGFGACRSHLDFGIAVIVDPEASLAVSAESDDVRWWPVSALPGDAAPALDTRIRSIRRRARRSASGSRA